jgi:hypothetical protein
VRKYAHVHRFYDRAAIAFCESQTRYLSADEAERFAQALLACVADIRAQPQFHESEFKTFCEHFPQCDLDRE